MSEQFSVLPTDISELSRYDRFRSAMHASRAGKPVTADEMIEVALAERDRIEKSCHRAEDVYGAPFDGREVRHCVVLEQLAHVFGKIQERRDEIDPIMNRAPTPKRRRA